MNDRSDAVRYARELFDMTWRHQQADQVADELDAVAEAMHAQTVHMRPLFHPLVPKAKKIAAVRALTTALGISRPTAVLLEALSEGYRLGLVGAVASSFRERLNHKHGVVQARVTTAAALAPEKSSQVAARLSEVTGRKVLLQTRVDPSIIGGVVAQIDSTVYDGSVTRQLARMRAKLVENV
jgi:F-type H+-transporting ATPase subunit delta